MQAETRLARACWSSDRTSSTATTAEVFLPVIRPRRALPLTMQYLRSKSARTRDEPSRFGSRAHGVPVFRQRAGRNTTSSIGSTSSAITTILAFLASIKATTWFKPYLAKTGFLVSCVVALSPDFSRASASDNSRAFFSCFDSGLYLFSSWNNWVAVFLSSVWENCAMAGGTCSEQSERSVQD